MRAVMRYVATDSEKRIAPNRRSAAKSNVACETVRYKKAGGRLAFTVKAKSGRKSEKSGRFAVERVGWGGMTGFGSLSTAPQPLFYTN
jgi:hypothetical protein